MSEPTELLYAKLLGETAGISWQELQPFFARGAVLRVDGSLDLVEVATAIAQDDGAKVQGWLVAGGVRKLLDSDAEDFASRDPDLWAVVVAPWVLVQERAAAPVVH